MPYADPAAQREYQRQWVAKRRAAFFDGKRCEWCASTDALELHHRDPSKKVGHAIWAWSEPRRQAEIAKCLVLCRRCHRRAHREAWRVEAELRHPHGTIQRHYLTRCRCDPCRQARRDHDREAAA